MKNFKTVDLVFAAMFVALMMIGANITSWMPFLQIGPVPLSLQPFFCILAGLLLGSRVAGLSMIVYLLIGAIGIPVFSKFGSGIGHIIGPTGGFLIAYPFAAYFAGKFMEFRKNLRLSTFITASFLGAVVIYFIGTNWMYVSMNYVLGTEMAYIQAWNIMKYFALKDVAFTLLGAFIAPRLFKAVFHSSSLGRSGKSNVA